MTILSREDYDYEQGLFYDGPERRHANAPRRQQKDRRYHHRENGLIAECRTGEKRRTEDDEGFIEIANLYPEE